MATYFEDFEGMGVGSPPTGWTQRLNDPVHWTTNVESLDSEKQVEWLNGGFGGGLSALTQNTVGSISGACEIASKFKIPTLGNYPQVLGVIYGNTAGDAGYYVAVTAANTIGIQRWTSSGPSESVGSTFSFTLAANTFYWFRLGVDGSGNFALRIWADGGSEPGSAQATGTSTTLTSGFIGMAASDYSMLPRFSNFGIGTAGSSAPLTGGGGSSPVPAAMHHLRTQGIA